LYDSSKTLSKQLNEEKFNLNEYRKSAENFKSEELEECFCSFNGIHDKPFLMKKIKD